MPERKLFFQLMSSLITNLENIRDKKLIIGLSIDGFLNNICAVSTWYQQRQAGSRRLRIKDQSHPHYDCFLKPLMLKSSSIIKHKTDIFLISHHFSPSSFVFIYVLPEKTEQNWTVKIIYGELDVKKLNLCGSDRLGESVLVPKELEHV